MCRPPDLTPHLPATNIQQNALPNQSYVSSQWITQQQEPWNPQEQSGWDWHNLAARGMNPQQQLKCDPSNHIPTVATLGLPVKPPIEDKFTGNNSFGFVGSSVSQPFNPGQQASWSAPTSKIPLQPQNTWSGRPVTSPMELPLQQTAQGYPTMYFPRKPLSQQPLNAEFSDPSLAKWTNALNSSAHLEAPKPANSKLPSWNNTSLNPTDNMESDEFEDPPALKNKKIKRMLSNRASAKRSRQRRQERLDELEIQSAKLHVEHAAMNRKLKEALESSRRFQNENSRLKREVEELKSQLQQNNPKRCKLNPEDAECVSLEAKHKTSASSDKSSSHYSLGNPCIDVSSEVEDVKQAVVLQNADGYSLNPQLASAYSESPFSPDSSVTANVNFESLNSVLPDFSSFNIPSPDSIGNGLDNLAEDWFSDLVGSFDEKSLAAL